MASPAELVLHYHCINASCVGFRDNTGIGAAIFPSDTITKYPTINSPPPLTVSMVNVPITNHRYANYVFQISSAEL